MLLVSISRKANILPLIEIDMLFCSSDSDMMIRGDATNPAIKPPRQSNDNPPLAMIAEAGRKSPKRPLSSHFLLMGDSGKRFANIDPKPMPSPVESPTMLIPMELPGGDAALIATMPRTLNPPPARNIIAWIPRGASIPGLVRIPVTPSRRAEKIESEPLGLMAGCLPAPLLKKATKASSRAERKYVNPSSKKQAGHER